MNIASSIIGGGSLFFSLLMTWDSSTPEELVGLPGCMVLPILGVGSGVFVGVLFASGHRHSPSAHWVAWVGFWSVVLAGTLEIAGWPLQWRAQHAFEDLSALAARVNEAGSGAVLSGPFTCGTYTVSEAFEWQGAVFLEVDEKYRRGFYFAPLGAVLSPDISFYRALDGAYGEYGGGP